MQRLENLGIVTSTEITKEFVAKNVTRCFNSINEYCCDSNGDNTTFTFLDNSKILIEGNTFTVLKGK